MSEVLHDEDFLQPRFNSMHIDEDCFSKRDEIAQRYNLGRGLCVPWSIAVAHSAVTENGVQGSFERSFSTILELIYYYGPQQLVEFNNSLSFEKRMIIPDPKTAHFFDLETGGFSMEWLFMDVMRGIGFFNALAKAHGLEIQLSPFFIGPSDILDKYNMNSMPNLGFDGRMSNMEAGTLVLDQLTTFANHGKVALASSKVFDPQMKATTYHLNMFAGTSVPEGSNSDNFRYGVLVDQTFSQIQDIPPFIIGSYFQRQSVISPLNDYRILNNVPLLIVEKG